MKRLFQVLQDEADADGGDSGGAPAPAPAAAQPADWIASLDQDTRTYVEGKGWKEPAHVVDGYRNLERVARADPSQVIKLPSKDADSSAWIDVWTRLGRPETPEGYEVAAPEALGGDKFAEWAKDTFHKLNVPAEMAKGISGALDEYVNSVQSEIAEAQQAAAQQELNSLKTEWGAAFEHKLDLGRRAARALGVDNETLEKIETHVGTAGILKMFAAIGEKIGEDSFVGSGANGGGRGGFNVLSPAEAEAKIAELRADESFRKRYLAGDKDALARMDALQQMAVAKHG